MLYQGAIDEIYWKNSTHSKDAGQDFVLQARPRPLSLCLRASLFCKAARMLGRGRAHASPGTQVHLYNRDRCADVLACSSEWNRWVKGQGEACTVFCLQGLVGQRQAVLTVVVSVVAVAGHVQVLDVKKIGSTSGELCGRPQPMLLEPVC